MDQQHRFRCSYQGPRAGRLCRNRETRSGSIAQTKAPASTWAVFESSRLPCFPGLADFLFHVQTTKPCKSRSQDWEVPTEWGEKPPKSRLAGFWLWCALALSACRVGAPAPAALATPTAAGAPAAAPSGPPTPAEA